MEQIPDRRTKNGRRRQDEVCFDLIDQGLCQSFKEEDDLAKSTISLKDVLIIIGVLISGAVSISTVYNNLNSDIKDVKHDLAMFRQQSEEKTGSSANDIIEIKKSLNDINTKLNKLDLTLGIITKRKLENMSFQEASSKIMN